MKLYSVAFVGLSLALSGCVTPVQTLIQNQSKNSIPAAAVYMLASGDEKPAPHLQKARTLINQALAKKGYVEKETARFDLHISLSQRSFDIKVRTSPDASSAATAEFSGPAERKCKGQKFALNVQLVEVATGEVFYTGEAAECHKTSGFSLNDALPFLVAAALSNLNNGQSKRIEERARS